MSCHHHHHLLLLLLLASFLFLCLVGGSAQCLPAHRDSLLQLKVGFSTPTDSTASWVRAIDCCRWSGVTCDTASGEVIGLDLSGLSIYGTVDPALFSLTSLRSLNLSLNQLNFSAASPGFETLTKLTSLNLSTSGFSGQIPIGISRLTNLVALDFSDIYLASRITLVSPNLRTLIQNLTQLEVLNLDGVSINSTRSEWCRAVSKSTPNLRVLSLSNSGLSGPIYTSLTRLRYLTELRLHGNNFSSEVPEVLGNLPSLTLLRLDNCQLKGQLARSIFELRNLTSLDLSRNPMLTGSLPDSIGNLALLKSLKLSGCKFSGPIPQSISSLTKLSELDISNNNLSGEIPALGPSASSIILSHNNFNGSIPNAFGELQNLKMLDLQNNSLTGMIPVSLFSLPKLQSLQLSQNRLSGHLDNIQNLSPSLMTIDLSRNSLQGTIPTSIFNLSSLKILSLSYNNFSGTVDLNLLQSLTNLTSLDLSNNKLTVLTQERYSFTPHITTLKLAFCNMTNFPGFLRNQTTINHLDLSGNKIGGSIPNWLWTSITLSHLNLSYNSLTRFERPLPDLSNSSLNVVDLHSNKIEGPIMLPPPLNFVLDYSDNSFVSSIPSNMSLTFSIFFAVSNNSLTGQIPSSICDSPFLQVLDLSLNMLSGPIPSCLAQMAVLRILNLRGNRFNGTVPSSFSANCSLRTINLNMNKLEGELPPSMSNCRSLEVLDLGNNQMSGSFPSWLGKLPELRVLVLRSNKFSGSLEKLKGLNGVFEMLQIIDLSSNNFTGSFSSDCFRNWKSMMRSKERAFLPIVQFNFLVLSHLYYQDTVMATIKGQEMTLVKILTIFTSIDVSNNRFVGSIPEAIGELNSLYVLNMSRNQFTGPIPSTIGGLNQLESLDLSQNKLSGEIPMELANLTFLSQMNLSCNLLVGRIPSSTQLSTFTNSSYIGNRGLCGNPLSNQCLDTNASSASESNQMDYFPASELNWVFIFTGLGIGGGLALVVGPLLLSSNWRTYFNDYVDNILLAILPSRFWYWAVCGGGRVDAEIVVEDSREEEEEERRDHPFCVFCTKLKFSSGRLMIHHTECTCARKEQ